MIDIALFGPTMVWVDGRTYTGRDLGGVKPRQILEMLALAPGRPLPKDQIAERLWEGRPPGSYVATLESYVCGLRHQLALNGGRNGVLATRNKSYVLDGEQVRVDLDIARRLLSRGGGAAIATAVGLAKDGLLDSSPYATWADLERRTFDEDVAAACLRGAPVAQAAGGHGLAVLLARTAVAHDGYSEIARQLLMRSLWRAGERSEAVRTYVDFRQTIYDELGLEPGPASQALYVTILRDESPSTTGGTDVGLELGLLMGLLKSAVENSPPQESLNHAGMLELGQLLLSLASCPAPGRSTRSAGESAAQPAVIPPQPRSSPRSDFAAASMESARVATSGSSGSMPSS